MIGFSSEVSRSALAYASALVGRQGSAVVGEEGSSKIRAMMHVANKSLEFAGMGLALSLVVGSTGGAALAVAFTAVHLGTKLTSHKLVAKLDGQCTRMARVANAVASVIFPWKIGGSALLLLPISAYTHFYLPAKRVDPEKIAIAAISYAASHIPTPPETLTQKAASSLIKAIEAGNLKTVRGILNGIPPTLRAEFINGSEHERALIFPQAAAKADGLEIVKLLHANGALIDKSGRSGSPLYYAVKDQRNDTALYLLSHGATVSSDLLYSGLSCMVISADVATKLFEKSGVKGIHLKNKMSSTLDLVAGHYDSAEAADKEKWKKLMMDLIAKGGRFRRNEEASGISSEARRLCKAELARLAGAPSH